VALITGMAVGISGPILGLALGEQWVMPSWWSLGLIFCSGLFLIGGYLTAVDFMRHGDISVVAPFRYTVIVFAMIVGYIVWGEVPDLPDAGRHRRHHRHRGLHLPPRAQHGAPPRRGGRRRRPLKRTQDVDQCGAFGLGRGADQRRSRRPALLLHHA
jgi:hypothetical protein